jgi:hypothetical protein
VFYIDVTKVDRMLHMLQWLYTYVSSVYSKCFICFRYMLQVFHLNVAKVDLDVAYMQVFYVFSYICCISSGCVMYVCKGYTCFQVFFMFCKCFRRML